jgi:hypothetical protein
MSCNDWQRAQLVRAGERRQGKERCENTVGNAGKMDVQECYRKGGEKK